ncbi:hypothetical protein [Kiloniella litopenaei]|uniref:hypothetical protein n=1 Tax=Kiloniella litopenaei TaxID=1549748 RepID=UPI003BAAE505
MTISYMLPLSFLGVEGLFETLPVVRGQEDQALINGLSSDPQPEDTRTQLSKIQETDIRADQNNDLSLMESTQYLNLLDEEHNDPLASLIITGTTEENLLHLEDTNSQSGQSYHQSIDTILELLNTQGVLDPTEILSTAAQVDGQKPGPKKSIYRTKAQHRLFPSAISWGQVFPLCLLILRQEQIPVQMAMLLSPRLVAEAFWKQS